MSNISLSPSFTTSQEYCTSALLLISQLFLRTRDQEGLEIPAVQGQYCCGQAIPTHADHAFLVGLRSWEAQLLADMLNCWLAKGKGHRKDLANNDVSDCASVPKSVLGPVSLVGTARWKEIYRKNSISETFPLFSENEGEKQHPHRYMNFPKYRFCMQIFMMIFHWKQEAKNTKF